MGMRYVPGVNICKKLPLRFLVVCVNTDKKPGQVPCVVLEKQGPERSSLGGRPVRKLREPVLAASDSVAVHLVP